MLKFKPDLDKYFLQLCRKCDIQNCSIKKDCIRSKLQVKIQVISNENQPTTIHLYLSDAINNQSKEIFRLTTCLSFWIPYCIEIAKRIKTTFSLEIEASDEGNTNILSMDSLNIENLIPDEFCMIDHKKNRYLNKPKTFEEFYSNWQKRKSTMFWRGSTTGGEFNSIKSFKNLERVKLCLKYKEKKGFNLKISKVVQSSIPKQIINQWIQSEGISGNTVNESSFLSYRYYPDIPGNALAWGTIRKHVGGSLIFRPCFSRYLYYYKFMVPWLHYIPIAKDFSDLEEKLNWANENSHEAIRIAYNGYIIANKYMNNIPEYFISAAIKKLEY